MNVTLAIVLTLAMVACGNKQAAQGEVAEEPQSEVLKAFADSVNNVAPMAWANIGEIENVSYEKKEMTFLVKAPEELMEPNVKQWISSFIVNNVYLFGPSMQQECLDKGCSMLFKIYTTDKNKIEYSFKLTPAELKKKFAPAS